MQKNKLFVFLKKALLNAVYIEDHVRKLSGDFEEQRKFIRMELSKRRYEIEAMHSVELGISKDVIENERIIVSLTTHGKRIHTVFRTIECMFQQTQKANKIILWIGKDEFPSIDNLPISIKKQCKRGLEVRFVEDIRSYTKLIPALNEFPDDCIITIDDDIIYPHDLIERLYNAHKSNPGAVCCTALRKIELDTSSKFKPYKYHELELLDNSIKTTNYIAEGFGGIFYPPKALYKDACNQNLFLKLAPNADDIWFKAMELLNNTPLCPVGYEGSLWDWILVDDSVQDVGLMNKNVYNDLNDIQLKNVCDYYSLYDYFE